MLKPESTHDVVFLLDNDRFKADLDARLRRDFGADQARRYWALYDSGRQDLGYADYLATLQAFRERLDDDPDVPQLIRPDDQ